MVKLALQVSMGQLGEVIQQVIGELAPDQLANKVFIIVVRRKRLQSFQNLMRRDLAMMQMRGQP